MGGPAAYTDGHGGYEHMLARHGGLGIDPELRLRFVTLLSRALDDAGLPADPEFRAAIMGYAEWGTPAGGRELRARRRAGPARARPALGLGRRAALHRLTRTRCCDGVGVSEASAPAFADLGLRPELLQALTALGYEEPTPIQREAIAPLLAGRDLLGQAATGTGKTAAFALPLLQRLSSMGGKGPPKALVLAPTRELATQVSEAIHKYGRGLGARVLPIYGGQPFTRQLRALQSGVDVVVATPGRALDHIRRGTMRVDALEIVVLDEADEMLDMGFTEDIEAILAGAPDGRQTILFSATMPARIKRIAKRAPDRSGATSTSARRRPRPGRRRRSASPPTSSPARTRPPRWGGCSTSSSRRRRWCSAARARTSTSSPRRSTAAGTAPRRCTAGCRRTSARRCSAACGRGRRS